MLCHKKSISIKYIKLLTESIIQVRFTGHWYHSFFFLSQVSKRYVCLKLSIIIIHSLSCQQPSIFFRWCAMRINNNGIKAHTEDKRVPSSCSTMEKHEHQKKRFFKIRLLPWFIFYGQRRAYSLPLFLSKLYLGSPVIWKQIRKCFKNISRLKEDEKKKHKP